MGINQDRLVRDFIKYVTIDSESRNERALADCVIEKLHHLGFTVMEDQAGASIGGNCGNIIAKKPGSLNSAGILFCAHLDRVTPGTGIKPRIENDVIYSNGETILGSDDAAGIATILEALYVLEEEKLDHPPIEVVFTVAEEVGLLGAAHLDPKNITARRGYFLDGDGEVGTIVSNAPAQKMLRAVIEGRSAHAGIAPEEGINAIQAASAGIAAMQLGRIDHETTANVGQIEGGHATNIVPDSVTVRGEARSRNSEKLERQIQSMKSSLETGASRYGAKALVEITDCYPSFHLADDHPVVRLALEAARGMGLQPTTKGGGGGSDANIFNGFGVASVVLGIGFEKVHSTQEHISIRNLCLMAEYVLSLIRHAREEESL